MFWQIFYGGTIASVIAHFFNIYIAWIFLALTIIVGIIAIIECYNQN